MNETDFKQIYEGVKEAPNNMSLYNIEQYLIWLNKEIKHENK